MANRCFLALLILSTSMAPAAGAAADRVRTADSAPIRIGAYYTDALNGVCFLDGDRAAFLLSVAWIDPTAGLQDGYNALAPKLVRMDTAAPDGAFRRVSWRVGRTTIRFDWARTGSSAILGRVAADGPVRIVLQTRPTWRKFSSSYSLNATGVTGAAAGARAWRLRVLQNPLARIALDDPAQIAADARLAQSRGEGPASRTALVFDLRGAPLEFAAGFGPLPDPSRADQTLSRGAAAYQGRRAGASGDWGDFVGAITNNLNNSQVYSDETGRIAHIVSRRWCLPDGQVLFCWDSFFNGLLASIEDPAGARATIRAVLGGQQPNGLVPNYSDHSTGWGVSADRSQPPVGSMCVWKMYERWPDRSFLSEVYPKLVKWHEWWFSPRPDNHLPYRDGNRDGLLEWGSETGVLQNAKYESGLDDSPMFDDATMDSASRTMRLDSVGLSSLWAADASYLSQIAAALGKREDAAKFLRERNAMADRINRLLWNDRLGMYCNRYWTPQRLEALIPAARLRTPDGAPGLHGEYFTGDNFEKPALARTDPEVDFNWTGAGPAPGLGPNHFSVRWTGQLTAPMTGDYTFETLTDDGVRLWVEDRKLVDNWTVHGATRDRSAAIRLIGGHSYTLKLEYYQAEGGAEVHLYWSTPDLAGTVFSNRLSPTNFYPMIAGIPTLARAHRVLQVLQDPKKFWGTYVCPTIARDDPAFPMQNYWRGKIWAPTNYLLFQGLKQYAPPTLIASFARKSVALFMRNWLADGTCHENFLATGEGSSDPHYTWGSLLCLIGIEAIAGPGPARHPIAGAGLSENMTLDRIPFNGRLYRIEVRHGKRGKRGSPAVVTIRLAGIHDSVREGTRKAPEQAGGP